MKRMLCGAVLVLSTILASCGNNTSIGIIGGADGPTAIIVAEKGDKNMYKQISAKEAKELMDTEQDYIILDTREQDEFDEGHIPGAILIPYTEIADEAEAVLPDKDQLILVYCRSGRRSKIASDLLVVLGYTNVVEFGGIIDWPYEIVK